MTSQILTFHPDHKGMLTNNDSNDIALYDLNDKQLRKSLDDLRFSCSIGNQRYYICQSVAGLCRQTNKCIKWKKKTVFHKKKCIEKEVEIIPVERHDFLVNSNAHCKSELFYKPEITQGLL